MTGSKINAALPAGELAINGGTPFRNVPMPPRFAMGAEERAMIDEVFNYYDDAGVDFGYQGHFEEEYCRLFSDEMGGGYADGVATGTAALFVSLAALQLPAGSEVIVSPITDPGTLSAIILNGLVPCLADSEPDSYNSGVDQIFSRVTPKTSAILVVHAAGRAADVAEIANEARRRKLKVIEDCSQAHFAHHDGKPVGMFGDVAAFSTMYRKAHITGASGGLVFTQNEEIYHLALAYADRGKPRWSAEFDDRDPSGYLFPALNMHTDEISCAIGIASLKRLKKTRERRISYVAGMDALHVRSGICRPYGWSIDDSPFYYPIIVEDLPDNVSKCDFAEAIKAEGIDLNTDYKYVVCEWPWVQKYLSDSFNTPNAKSIRDRSFNLYLNEKYSQQEIDDTLGAIAKVENSLSG